MSKLDSTLETSSIFKLFCKVIEEAHYLPLIQLPICDILKTWKNELPTIATKLSVFRSSWKFWPKYAKLKMIYDRIKPTNVSKLFISSNLYTNLFFNLLTHFLHQITSLLWILQNSAKKKNLAVLRKSLLLSVSYCIVSPVSGMKKMKPPTAQFNITLWNGHPDTHACYYFTLKGLPSKDNRPF